MTSRFAVIASGVLTLGTTAGGFLWVNAEARAMSRLYAEFGGALPAPTQLTFDLFSNPQSGLLMLILPLLLWGVGALISAKSEYSSAALLLLAAPVAGATWCLLAASLSLPMISLAGAIK